MVWKIVRTTVLTLLAAATVACEQDGGSPTEPEPFEGAALQLVAQGLVSPVTLAQPPDASGRLFVVDQIGRIRIVDASGQLGHLLKGFGEDRHDRPGRTHGHHRPCRSAGGQVALTHELGLCITDR